MFSFKIWFSKIVREGDREYISAAFGNFTLEIAALKANQSVGKFIAVLGGDKMLRSLDEVG